MAGEHGNPSNTVRKIRVNEVVSTIGGTETIHFETDADIVLIEDTAGKFTSNNVEGALQELATGVASAGKVDDVQDVNGASIVTNKIAKLSKAAVGLGNVDNTADADKNVKHATEAGKATNDSAGNKITDTYATKSELSEGLAGRATTKTYENYQAFVAAMGLLPKSDLKVGDNIYIKTLDVPDMWVTAVNETSTSYTYTNDQAIINALDTTSGLTVGYFSFSKLETEKVNLSAYQTKTDNTLETNSKTVVGAINEVKRTADGANSKASANATEISNIKDGTTVVKKAEHANAADNAANVTTNINGKAISSIFETDGTTIKEATHAGNATTANLANKVAKSLSFINATQSPAKESINYNGSVEQNIYFDDSDFTFSSRGTQLINLANTGVTAGQYSAVNVDAKGRVTAGGKSIEWGTAGQTEPSGDLMVGGLFMELISQ